MARDTKDDIVVLKDILLSLFMCLEANNSPRATIISHVARALRLACDIDQKLKESDGE